MTSSLLLVILLLWARFSQVNSEVACNSSQTCTELLYPGSECSTGGFCTNPYTKRGCLANRVPGWKKVRVCSSEDSPEAAALGYCKKPYSGLEYTEIRLAGQVRPGTGNTLFRFIFSRF